MVIYANILSRQFVFRSSLNKSDDIGPLLYHGRPLLLVVEVLAGWSTPLSFTSCPLQNEEISVGLDQS